MNNSRVFLSVPHMSGNEQRYIDEAFRSNWLTTMGANIDAFEAGVSETLDGRHTLAVSSGTAALHLVLRAAGVGPGDRVALSTLTFAGSLFPIFYQGAIPVLLDSEEESWNLDPQLVEEYLAGAARKNELPKALIVVHLYGQHADLDPILAACERYGVTLIEDAAESLGANYKGRPTATVAPLAILSFNGNKIITTTSGGMVVAKDPDVIALTKKWANQSREPAVEYLHTEIGYNYRMSNVLAGIGRAQLEVLDERVSQRRAVFDRYVKAFADIPELIPQPEAAWGLHTRWLSVFRVRPGARGVTSLGIIAGLAEKNIEARPVWRPMHTQPLMEGAEVYGGAVAESLYRTGFCLPSSSSLTRAEQDRTIEAVRNLVREPARVA